MRPRGDGPARLVPDDVVWGHDHIGPVTGDRLRGFVSSALDTTRAVVEQISPLLDEHARRLASAGEASWQAWQCTWEATVAIAPVFSTEHVAWSGQARWADAAVALRQARAYEAAVGALSGPLAKVWDDDVHPLLRSAARRLVVDPAAAPGGKEVLWSWLAVHAHLAATPDSATGVDPTELPQAGRWIAAQLLGDEDTAARLDRDGYEWWDRTGSPYDPPRRRSHRQIEDHVLATHLPNSAFTGGYLRTPVTVVDWWLAARALDAALAALADGAAFPASLHSPHTDLTFLEGLVDRHRNGEVPDERTLARFENFEANLDHHLHGRGDLGAPNPGLRGWRALCEVVTVVQAVGQAHAHQMPPFDLTSPSAGPTLGGPAPPDLHGGHRHGSSSRPGRGGPFL